jgi:nicotinamidase-related amidase
MNKPPTFYTPEAVGQVRLSPWGRVQEEAHRWKQKYNITPASEDQKRIALFGIDCQIGFCAPGASLYVPGAEADMRRAVEWLYRHLGEIHQLYFSLDTHHLYQIFHADWWQDEEGNPPPPLTPITAAEIKAGRWIPKQSPDASLEYCERLESRGKYTLTIWPYHTLLGSVSHALLPDVMEAVSFHGLVREQAPHFLVKGEHPQTENYSVFSPEVQELSSQEVGRFEQELLMELLEFEQVYVIGEARSHCVLSTLQDLERQLQQQFPREARDLFGKFVLLEDTTSPVPAPPIDPLPPSLNFPVIAEQELQRMESNGLRRTTTEQPLEGSLKS